MSAAFIIILGGIFLTVAVAAIYILVDKKVISNPLDYISSIFSPNAAGTMDGTSGTSGTSDTSDTSGTGEYESEESSEYVDKYSPNKPTKGRYIWITRENANSTAYRNAVKGYYDMWPADTYVERAPISVTEITIMGKDGEILTQKQTPLSPEELEPTTEERYDDNNYVYVVDDRCFDGECYGVVENELKVVWDGTIIESYTGASDGRFDPQPPYSKGARQTGDPQVGGARYKIIKTTQRVQLTLQEQLPGVTVSDTSSDIGLDNTNYLFNFDVDLDGEDQKDRFTTRGSISTVDYIKIDLKSNKTISAVQLDSLYETDDDMKWNFNLHGVYVIITREDDMNRPVAITPIIKRTGTSHVFSFPGTEWDTDTEDELKPIIYAGQSLGGCVVM